MHADALYSPQHHHRRRHHHFVLTCTSDSHSLTSNTQHKNHFLQFSAILTCLPALIYKRCHSQHLTNFISITMVSDLSYFSATSILNTPPSYQIERSDKLCPNTLALKFHLQSRWFLALISVKFSAMLSKNQEITNISPSNQIE